MEKWGAGPTPGGGSSGFRRLLEVRSFRKAGPETCHKKCAQGTFWKKWVAGPAPGGTYLIFVGSWKGGHFVSQAQKLVTINVPKEHFGKSV